MVSIAYPVEVFDVLSGILTVCCSEYDMARDFSGVDVLASCYLSHTCVFSSDFSKETGVVPSQ